MDVKTMGVIQCRLGDEIGVQQGRIGDIVAGKWAIPQDAGTRLSRYVQQ